MTPSSKSLLGAHFSIAGGLENALYAADRLNCGAVQIFTKNGRSWKEPELTGEKIESFERIRRELGILRVFSHCTYLINIASDDPEKLEKSRQALRAELIRSGRLGLDGVVLHPGAHMGLGVEKGIAIAADSLNRVLGRDNGRFPPLLIETTAGTGTCLGSRFEEIGDLILKINDNTRPVGVCLDTSHIFSAGYDLRTPGTLDHTLKQFDACIGLSRLGLIHLNDSKPGLGARKDRHEHIGKGMIGRDGFKAVMTHPALLEVPKIIETPKELNGREMDPVNLSILKKLG